MEVNVIESIKQFNRSLLPNMVALKYKALAEGPYRFFRGTCHLFYEDLSKAPAFPSGPPVWACGDLHLENFGSFKSNNRFVYFDLNDFDESLLAPACWEVVRMVTSIFVAFNALQIPEKRAEQWAALFLETYSHILEVGKPKHIESRLAKGVVRHFLEQVTERRNKSLLKKHAVRKKGGYRFNNNDERHASLDDAFKKELIEHVSAWKPQCGPELEGYQIVDAAFRIVGTGSLGVRRYILLLQQQKKKEKYLLLDMKESRPSSLLPYVAVRQPMWPTPADRELTIQSQCQYANAALLSTTFFKGSSFVIQELQPAEDKIDFSVIDRSVKDVNNVIEDMALLAASAHLRSAGRKGSAIPDELIAFGADRSWHTDLLRYAAAYARKVNADYQLYLDAYKSGAFRSS